MAFLTLSLAAFISATNPNLPPPDMACKFDETSWISVRPKGKTATPGLFVVNMWIDGRPIVGNVSPLEKTDARDVVVRGKTGDQTLWLIAVKDNGTAILHRKADTSKVTPVGTLGHCTNVEPAFEVWLVH